MFLNNDTKHQQICHSTVAWIAQ